MDTQPLLELAGAHLRAGRLKEAGRLYAEVLRGEPDQPDALYELGRLARGMGQLQAAVGFLSQIVKRQPSHPDAGFVLGTVLAALGQNELATMWYRAQLEARPSHPDALAGIQRQLLSRRDTNGMVELARQLIGNGAREAAERLLRTVCEVDPGHAAAALLLGPLAIRHGDPAAATLMRRGLVEEPAHAGALTGLGSAAAAMGNGKASSDWALRAVAATSDPDRLLEAGRLLLDQRAAKAAEACFRLALAARPGDPAASLAIARAQVQAGDTGAAIRLARAALTAQPQAVEASEILGEAFARQGAAAGAIGLIRADLRAGRAEHALAAAEAIARVDSKNGDAHLLAGAADLVLSRADVARLHLEAGLSRVPDSASGLADLGRAHAALGEDAAALVWLKRARARTSPDAELVLDLLEAELRLGRMPEAQRLFESLPADRNQTPEAILRRAGALCGLGHREEGLALAWRLVEARPTLLQATRFLVRLLAEDEAAAALLRLALMHQEAGRNAVAAVALRAAVEVEPANPQAIYLLGRAAIAPDPQAAGRLLARLAHMGGLDTGLLLSAGEWVADLKRYDTAVALMRRGIEADFEMSANHSYAFFFNFLNQCDWPERALYVERFTRMAERRIAGDDPSFQVNPSIFVFLGADERLLLHSARHFARHSFPKRPPKALARGHDPKRPLRVGYLSLYLSNHHIGYSQIEIVKGYDPDRVEVFAYSPPRLDDHVQDELKRHVAAFKEIDRPDPERVARMIAADGVDVLVDLDGYVNGIDGLFTLSVMSHRPAPVQMLFHNYVGPSGAEFVDYVIGDNVLFPAGTDSFYSEKLIRLPPCYYPAPPIPIADHDSRRSDWELPAQGAVFANFGHFYKIEPGCFAVWMRILQRVPGSVMWFNHWEQPTAVKNMRQAALSHGIEPERLIFGSKIEKHLHLARLRHADLFLDTLVYSSGVTSIDALWAGLPVLTVAGDSFARRVSASLNAGIGMQELTCATVGEYEEKAVRIALDAEERARLRQRLSAQRDAAPLFNQRVLAGHLQRAFAKAWSLHQSGAPPRTIDLSAPALGEPVGSD